MTDRDSKKYLQCKLTSGTLSKIVWIPSDFAFEGKTIKVKNTDKEKDVITIEGKKLHRVDTWETWFVESVFDLTPSDDPDTLYSYDGTLVDAYIRS